MFIKIPEKYKRTNNDLQNIHRKLKISLQTGGELRGSGRVSSSCSTSGTRCNNLFSNPVISHERGKDRDVFTTSGTYPYRKYACGGIMLWICRCGRCRSVDNFPIVNFQFICSNIPAAPAYGVYLSQMIRYSIMDKQRYTKHCTENQRLNNTNNIKQTKVSSGASHV
jgi:hypothetical protein